MWDGVIDHLHDDHQALKACVLTCRAWRRTARGLIWRVVRVCNPPILDRLRSYLHEAPDLAGLVQSLCLSWLSIFTNMKTLKLERTTDDQKEVPDIQLVQSIPESGRPYLPNVIELGLSYDSLTAMSVVQVLSCFPHVDHHPIERPLQLLSLPCLRHLVFEAIDLRGVLPTILHGASTALETLYMRIPPAPVHVLRNMLDFSQNMRLVSLIILVKGGGPFRHGWADHLASALTQINSSHTSLAHVMLQIPSVLPTSATTGSAWIDPGDFVGHELSRVLDDLPSVTIFLYQQRISLTMAHKTRTALEASLSERFPGLYAHHSDSHHFRGLHLLTERPESHTIRSNISIVECR
ncbi:uncharacterized protein B0H18DRAFT_974400 [Fomitopsis serialis]|uniref:uncharacterized protein n=1 Tax=Fomitopsis serialis TaxID=139415 RepID=UPI0020077310|nr:uncharacterized protein B0H18DRAFT_974400 [Neoantrodia serialis]KAH9936557.1 hypothetical protein B0H18DRAFT_974400 [Neoantrodia serialis]